MFELQNQKREREIIVSSGEMKKQRKTCLFSQSHQIVDYKYLIDNYLLNVGSVSRNYLTNL